MDLLSKHCIPCEEGTPPFTKSQAEKYLPQVPDWHLIEDNKRIERKFKFKNFVEALAFINKIGEIAESEGHHPNIRFGWGYASITSSTHNIGGLSENDFILAAKINQLI